MAIRRYHTEASFFDGADELRAAFDAKFDNPYESPPAWEYVFVEGLYTHLRGFSRHWFPDALFEAFLNRLKDWCRNTLGLVPTAEPRLHLMVDGCSLSLHSDFHNGAMGYVYSLTRWAQRSFRGGETLLLRDGLPNYKRHQAHGAALHEVIPAHFNQLLVFDDRIVHATPRIEGNMDPRQGRIALVGHLRAGAAHVSGPISESDVRVALLACQHSLREQLSRHSDVQGTISYRLRTLPDGAVESVTPLMDGLVTAATGYESSTAVTAVKECITDTLGRLRLPAATAPSTITLSILVPIPNLRPIEIAVPHALPSAVVVERLRGALQTGSLELVGEWSGSDLTIRDPCDGVIRVDDRCVVASLSPPSWVPSQRAGFEQGLRQALERAVEPAATSPGA
jgi:hypothetical protein